MGTSYPPVRGGLPGVYLMMNTNYGAQGVVNARVLAEVLGIRLVHTQLLYVWI